MKRVERFSQRDVLTPVEQVEIEAFGAKTLQAGVARGHRAAPRRVMRQHLADEEDTGATAGDGFADNFLGPAVGVHLCRVDERHAEVEAEPKCGHFRRAPASVFTHSPRPLAEGGDHLARRERHLANVRRSIHARSFQLR